MQLLQQAQLIFSITVSDVQHVHNQCTRPDPSAPFTPHRIMSKSLRWIFPGDVLAPGVRSIRRVWESSSAFSLRGSNLRAICCYLENVPHTLHGHICTRALTSLLFLTPARCWRLLWWCHTGLQNKSDCLSWVTLPACFSCCVCLCLFICQTGFFFVMTVPLVLHLQICCVVFSKYDNNQSFSYWLTSILPLFKIQHSDVTKKWVRILNSNVSEKKPDGCSYISTSCSRQASHLDPGRKRLTVTPSDEQWCF